MIEVKNVSKFYGKFPALQDINFTVNKGDIVAFLGPNGAGKTTTMRIITGYMAPTRGDVFINGKDVFDEPEEVKRIIGYLPENPPLYPELTVNEYLRFIAEIKGVEKENIEKRVGEVIELVGIEDRSNTLISFLSKGLKQRVGLAQSIVNNPSVLILDEPTVGLDPRQVIEIRELITHLAKRENHTIILSTHLLAEASEICEKAIIINNGKIVAVDAISNLQKLNQTEFHIFATVVRNHDEIAKAAKKIGSVNDVTTDGTKIEVISGKDVREEFSKLVVGKDGGLLELSLTANSLEDIYVKMVQ